MDLVAKSKSKPEDKVEKEVKKTLAIQDEMQQLQTELEQDPKFQRLLELQRTVPKQMDEAWDKVFEVMEANDVKSIKGDWGSVTVVEREFYKATDLDKIDDTLTKTQLDTKKVGAYSKLNGKLPDGVTSTTKRYLMKKIK